jgi:hypothetical protein
LSPENLEQLLKLEEERRDKPDVEFWSYSKLQAKAWINASEEVQAAVIERTYIPFNWCTSSSLLTAEQRTLLEQDSSQRMI